MCNRNLVLVNTISFVVAVDSVFATGLSQVDHTTLMISEDLRIAVFGVRILEMLEIVNRIRVSISGDENGELEL